MAIFGRNHDVDFKMANVAMALWRLVCCKGLTLVQWCVFIGFVGATSQLVTGELVVKEVFSCNVNFKK